MAEVEELEPLPLFRGCMMRFFVDHAQPPDAMKHQWTEASYDGHPESELLAIGGHWHKNHDEYIEVLSGRISIYLEGKGDMVLGPGDPGLHIPRWKVHSFHAFAGEAVRLREYTDPAGDFKEEFFRDFFQRPNPGLVMALRVFSDGDTYVSLPGNVKVLDQVFMAVAGGVARLFAPAKMVLVRKGGARGDADADADGYVGEGERLGSGQ